MSLKCQEGADLTDVSWQLIPRLAKQQQRRGWSRRRFVNGVNAVFRNGLVAFDRRRALPGRCETGTIMSSKYLGALHAPTQLHASGSTVYCCTQCH